MTRALPAAIVVALLAGCGGGDASTSDVRVYWVRDGKVWPAARQVEGDSVEAEALTALFDGPNADERALGLTSAIPASDGPSLTIEGDVARFEPQGEYSTAALAQIVYTLTQFPTITAVDVDKRYTRADFEEQTPLILVESPLAFEEVTTPLRVTGTANTFEATFQYELKDSARKVVDHNFVTATSGTGTRGTFDFTTKRVDDVGSLVVFELSANDGSRTNEVEIPFGCRGSRSGRLSSPRGGRALAVLAMRHDQRTGRERVPDVRSLAEPLRPRGEQDRGRPG